MSVTSRTSTIFAFALVYTQAFAQGLSPLINGQLHQSLAEQVAVSWLLLQSFLKRDHDVVS